MAAARYRHGKLKHKHTMIQGLRDILEELARLPSISAITPGMIRHTKGHAGGCHLKIKYHTPSGIKCLAYAGNSVQEVFFVSSDPARLTRELLATVHVENP